MKQFKELTKTLDKESYKDYFESNYIPEEAWEEDQTYWAESV